MLISSPVVSKRTFWLLVALSAAAVAAHAGWFGPRGTFTTALGLYLPAVGESEWGAALNQNFRILDARIAALERKR